jgi:hypothetical protein
MRGSEFRRTVVVAIEELWCRVAQLNGEMAPLPQSLK